MVTFADYISSNYFKIFSNYTHPVPTISLDEGKLNRKTLVLRPFWKCNGLKIFLDLLVNGCQRKFALSIWSSNVVVFYPIAPDHGLVQQRRHNSPQASQEKRHLAVRLFSIIRRVFIPARTSAIQRRFSRRLSSRPIIFFPVSFRGIIYSREKRNASSL